MKIKNFIIACAPFIFAICTAFTTNNTESMALVPAFISVKMSSTSPWICTDSGAQCQANGNLSCQIEVYTTQWGIKNVLGHPSIVQCTQTLKHDSATPEFSTLEVYDARNQ